MEKLRIRSRNIPKTDSEKDIRKKYSDVVDIAAIGHYTEFGFMSPKIKNICGKSKKIFGRAVTVRIPSQESKALHVAVSMAQEGDVIVVDRCGVQIMRVLVRWWHYAPDAKKACRNSSRPDQ